MKRSLFVILGLSLILVVFSTTGYSQKLAMDGKFGLSILSGNGNSSTGILFGGALDIPLNPNLFIRPEFNLTTHSGTPIEMAGVIKYNIPTTGYSTTFYVDGGMGLWFSPGGPYLGLDFGGGALFPLSGSNLKIPAEIRLGPIFATGATVFQIALTSGVRFNLP